MDLFALAKCSLRYNGSDYGRASTDYPWHVCLMISGYAQKYTANGMWVRTDSKLSPVAAMIQSNAQSVEDSVA